MISKQNIYDFLQYLMPKGYQFIEANLDNKAIPDKNTTYGIMQLHSIEEEGWNISDTIEYDSELITEHSQLKSIFVQIDFYGPHAFSYALNARQYLLMNLQNIENVKLRLLNEQDNKFKNIDLDLIDLKGLSELRNLTRLLDDKSWGERWSFDVDGFIVDTITENDNSVIDNIQINRKYIAGK